MCKNIRLHMHPIYARYDIETTEDESIVAFERVLRKLVSLAVEMREMLAFVLCE